MNSKMSCRPDPSKQCEISPLLYCGRNEDNSCHWTENVSRLELTNPEIVAAIFVGPNESPKVAQRAKNYGRPVATTIQGTARSPAPTSYQRLGARASRL